MIANASRACERAIVIGAGPSGLAAALTLAEGGSRPLVLEREAVVGGLMRSLRWQDFTVDLGRKELYTRFTEVDALWSETLKDGYVPYPHRVGSLYRGRILELSGRHRGPLRGVPIPWLAAGAVSMLGGWLGARSGPPVSYEAYWHGHLGSRFSRMLAQGYWEKFRGRRWADMPPPEDEEAGHMTATLMRLSRLARRGGVAAQSAWRHPMRGTGELFEAIHRRASELGATTRFNAVVRALLPLPQGGFEVESVEDGVVQRRTAAHVIAAVPANTLLTMLESKVHALDTNGENSRSVVLVYLFLNEPPRFPHAWLEINDPHLHLGRVTNYAAFSRAMVPDGKTALCAEFFCTAHDTVMRGDDAAATALAVSELVGAHLIGADRIIGSMVLRLPRTNAAASWREQQAEGQAAVHQALMRFPDLYHTNRPGSDWATRAGLLAGEAVLSGCRSRFDTLADPTLRHSAPLTVPSDARSSTEPPSPAALTGTTRCA